ncbi:hypothetical protein, partial [Enterobacter intestinihominis]
HAGYVRTHPPRRKPLRGNLVIRPHILVISPQFKRQSPGQKFINHDTQTVEIAPAVDGGAGTGGVLFFFYIIVFFFFLLFLLSIFLFILVYWLGVWW